MTAPTLWDYIAPAPATDVFAELVAIADRLLRTRGEFGATVGEVVYEYEKRGKQLGGVPMENPIMQQRQTSWLPRVMRAAGGVSTGRIRPSPVARHHKHRHSVYIRREVNA